MESRRLRRIAAAECPHFEFLAGSSKGQKGSTDPRRLMRRVIADGLGGDASGKLEIEEALCEGA